MSRDRLRWRTQRHHRRFLCFYSWALFLHVIVKTNCAASLKLLKNHCSANINDYQFNTSNHDVCLHRLHRFLKCMMLQLVRTGSSDAEGWGKTDSIPGRVTLNEDLENATCGLSSIVASINGRVQESFIHSASKDGRSWPLVTLKRKCRTCILEMNYSVLWYFSTFVKIIFENIALNYGRFCLTCVYQSSRMLILAKLRATFPFLWEIVMLGCKHGIITWGPYVFTAMLQKMKFSAKRFAFSWACTF